MAFLEKKEVKQTTDPRYFFDSSGGSV